MTVCERARVQERESEEIRVKGGEMRGTVRARALVCAREREREKRDRVKWGEMRVTVRARV